MNTPYGPIRKTPFSLLFFAVPALVIFGIALAMMAQQTGSITSALRSPTVLICGVLAVFALGWGCWFLSRPIVTLSTEMVTFPNGVSLKWSDIADVQAGKTTASVADADSGTSNVVHEVIRLHHGDNVTKIVTTWAASGPEVANARIQAAFDAHQ